MNMRNTLHEKTHAAKERIKKLRGATDQAASDWKDTVDDFIAAVHRAADAGESKYYMEMESANQQTILKVAQELKKELGDVLVITSPRGIEADWEVGAQGTIMLERGDMVQGKKPWNRDAMLGVVLQREPKKAKFPDGKDSYQIFWINPKGTVPLNFTTWEVRTSVSRIDGEEKLDKN